MIEAAMIWNEPNNKSHWDFEIDPDWRSELVELPGGKVTGFWPDADAALVTVEVPAADAPEEIRRRRTEGVLFTGNEFAPVLGVPAFPGSTETRTLRLDLRTGVASPLHRCRDRRRTARSSWRCRGGTGGG